MSGPGGWWCTGPSWAGTEPGLGWYSPGRGERRRSALPVGKALAFALTGERRCLGVRRGARWTSCPYAAVIDAGVARDQCADCARLDRSRSVAADTMADDPRTYGVYLAYFGPGLLKVGITAAERGAARLVEQGAITYAWLGHGPLMAARRAEALLGSALDVRDRFGKAEKRAARAALPPVPERVAALAGLHEAARGLAGWPEALEPAAFAWTDHTEVFGLERIPGAGVGECTGPAAGDEIVGDVVAGGGADLYVRGVVAPGEGAAEVFAVDTRLLAGWVLQGATGGVTTAVVRAPKGGAEDEQGSLF
ncbi:DUF2797 domain-containing protein [Streptomyces rimosus]|uniref:DUF2797 domain-containing protein n=1 Tax=Streptomyces rimosus TaxID=1927 RepID=UPI0004BF45C4|nr:DUF2797 domain-containing protein [Streptomyces rimosus]